MSGIPHDHYEPKTRGEKWVESRLPIISADNLSDAAEKIVKAVKEAR